MADRRTSATRQKVTHPRRGEVYLVAFDPTVGAEIQKTRPAVVIQNDIANRASPMILPRFGGQLDYAANAATWAFNSNSIGLM
jgi:mRNA-degrading endonuclease toxin of MazEF toxin-antitoxin module